MGKNDHLKKKWTLKIGEKMKTCKMKFKND